MGPLLVALAAILWATDALVRYPLIQHGLDPTFVVFFDHALAVALLTPFMFVKHRKQLTKVSAPQWAGLFLLGGGASALATVLFTASFKYVNPSVSILLQKLQPVFVVLLASIFLGERPKKTFYIWAPLALLAGLTISFPTWEFGFLGSLGSGAAESRGSLYALSAAGLWALATVVGKGVVGKLPPMVVTYWRFVFGLVTLAGMLAFAGSFSDGGAAASFAKLGDFTILRSLLYVALVPGMLALILYYQGMLRTTASKTTFMELLFPVTAVTLNTVFLNAPLAGVQAAAALVLLFSITQLSIESRR
ncbi:MAG: DMT family transporter [Bdellovibrionales bacterium]|nr:DMT family transporter [Bdellovibrionales bacterium]